MDTYIVKVPAVGDPTVEPFNSKVSYKQLSDAVGGYLELAPLPRRIVTIKVRGSPPPLGVGGIAQ